MSEDTLVEETRFARAAGKQLALLAAITVLGLTVLMFVLDALASLVGSDSGKAQAVNVADNSITIAIDTEPPQLDSTLQTDTVSGRIIAHVIEGAAEARRRRQPGGRHGGTLGNRHRVGNLLVAQGCPLEQRHAGHRTRLRVRLAPARSTRTTRPNTRSSFTTSKTARR